MMRYLGLVYGLLMITMVACQSPSAAVQPVPVPALSQAPASVAQPRPREVLLSDSYVILDMSGELPSYFERLDAASEGMSNKDLGLGSGFTEVQLYMSSSPYQVVYGYYTITKSKVEQAATDDLLRADNQIRSILQVTLEDELHKQGSDSNDFGMSVSHPNIGDSAAVGEGYFSAYGAYYGFDIAMFRRRYVIVAIASVYSQEDKQSLVPIATAVDGRIVNFK